VPAQDRFYAGGGGSVRGYGYQEVGPRFTDNNPQGGISLFESSFEVRKRLTNQWGLVAFLDAGGVGEQVNPDFTRPKYGAGLGVRYNLGFGPIRFDVATPLNPDKGDPAIQVYLSIGQSFEPAGRYGARPSVGPRRATASRRTAAPFAPGRTGGGRRRAGRGGHRRALRPAHRPGRAVVTAYLDGMTLGQWGRLHVSDLRGDIWSDFTIGRATVSDGQGVWLGMDRVAVRWRMGDLLRRRLHVRSIAIGNLRIDRRPMLGPAPPPSSGRAPLSLTIESLKVRLESRPAFSVRPGLFDITASLDTNRRGGFGGAVKLQSLLRADDGLDARFDMGLTKHLVIDAQAREGDGGAIAGSLGLPANLPFLFTAKADGSQAQARSICGPVPELRRPPRPTAPGTRLAVRPRSA